MRLSEKYKKHIPELTNSLKLLETDNETIAMIGIIYSEIIELEETIDKLKTQLRTIVSTGETAYFLDSVDLPLAVAKELQEAEELLNENIKTQ